MQNNNLYNNFMNNNNNYNNQQPQNNYPFGQMNQPQGNWQQQNPNPNYNQQQPQQPPQPIPMPQEPPKQKSLFGNFFNMMNGGNNQRQPSNENNGNNNTNQMRSPFSGQNRGFNRSLNSNFQQQRPQQNMSFQQPMPMPMQQQPHHNMPTNDPNVTFEPLDPAMLNQIRGARGMAIPPMNTPQQPMNTPQQPMNTPHQPMNTPHQPMNTPHQPMNTSHQPMNSSHQPINTMNEAGSPYINPKPSKPETSPPIYNDKYTEKIGSFIQGGKNASIFYDYLASIAKNDEHVTYLKQLSKDNSQMCLELNNIYVTSKGKPYDAKSINPGFNFEFKKGIQLGIKEESQSLKELSDIYNETTDVNTQKYINSLIYKKISDINMMNTMITETN